MKKVILIGGSPMTGKSSISALIAAKLKYPCLSTDDIGEIVQTAAGIDPMRGKDHTAYYAETPKEQLIADTHVYHKALCPAIRRLIEIHCTWSTPLLLEGWALYPRFVSRLPYENITSLWLIAADGVLETRLKKNMGFLQNAKKPALAAKNYLLRSLWHNDALLAQCRAYAKPYLFVDGKKTPEQLAKQVFSALAQPASM